MQPYVPTSTYRRAKSSFLCELFNGSKVHIFDIKNIIARAYGLTLKHGSALNYGWFDFRNHKYNSWESQ